MADKTTNYSLTKPLESEFYDIQVQNDNMDIIDAQMKDSADEILTKSSIVVIPSGEEIPVSERKENTYYLVEKEDAVTSGTVHVELQDKDGNILHPHTDMQAVGGLGEFSKL